MLQIGRVGIETPLANPFDMSWRSTSQGRQLTISGHIKDTATLTDAIHLRDALLQQTKRAGFDGVVAVSSVLDPTVDGFYILEDSSVGVTASLGALSNGGFFPYRIVLTDLNTRMFESILSGTLLSNDLGLVAGQAFVSAPAGFTSFWPMTGLGVDARETEEGKVPLFFGITPPDIPVWTVAPANYYKGACKIHFDSQLVPGIPLSDTVTDTWQIDNGLIRVRGTLTNRNIEVAVWDPYPPPATAAWSSLTQFQFEVDGTAYFSPWNHIVVLRNTPEEVAIRLIGSEGDSMIIFETGRATLDISIRRSSYFARGYWVHKGYWLANDLTIARSAADAAVSTMYGIQDAANDADGNKWFIGSRHTTIDDLVNGKLKRTVVGLDTTFDFHIGVEIIDPLNVVLNNQARALGDQYLYHVAEQVAPIVPGGVLP